MKTWRIGQKYLFNVLLAMGMLGASILACSFTDTGQKPSHYGVFLEQKGELIELQEQEIFDIPVEEQMGSTQTISDAQPTIVVWRSNTNLDYLEFLKLNQYLGESKNSVRYNATHKDDGIIEITPDSSLEDGVYCLIQGDPAAVILSGWCFRIGSHVEATAEEALTVEVSGKDGWQDSGITLQSGQSVKITYVSGMWAARVGFGPSLPDIWTDAAGVDFEIYYPDFDITGKFASLIGKIGNGPTIQIGRSYEFTSSDSGSLYLRMFDTDMSDNDGSITVKITFSQ